jgi:hypothetical protein
MKTYVIYKDASDHARPVIEFLREFYRQTGKQLDVIDPETREGDAFCRTYDIVEYPSLVALDANGMVQQLWRGLPLPRISEVSYYVT